MEVFKEIGPIRAFLGTQRARQLSIGFVPTMGALHEGHLALIRKSKAENDLTVCSIYVNPTQFNNATDLEKYPRTIESDTELLTREKCDVLFLPDTKTMYEHVSTLTFDFGALDKVLEGKFRPGHFSGVALVVSKLFHIVQPHRAYFGQKDYQQFLLVTKLVEELLFELEVTCFPTVREADGLALSSRNKRLSETGRKNALIIYESLQLAKTELTKGVSWLHVKERIEKNFLNSDFARLEYIELVDKTNLIPLNNVSSQNQRNAVILIAAYVEEVRLIDNIFVADNS